MLGKAVLSVGQRQWESGVVLSSVADYLKFGKLFPVPQVKCNFLRILNEKF